jgi:hypothetical protein
MMTQSAFAKDPMVTFAGTSVVSTAQEDWVYFGNSQGGIMGTLLMAVTTDILRGQLGVGGGPYSMLLPRSSDFTPLFDIIKIRYGNPVDRISLLALMQALWDRMDPVGYLHAISRSPLPNTPAHTVVFNYGLGDSQVSWLGCHTLARSVGATMFVSNVAEGNESLAEFPQVPDTTVLGQYQHVVQGWDFGAPQVPFVNIPPNEATDTHEFTRRAPTSQAQMAHFFYTGQIINACGGPCIQPPPSDDV